MNFDPRSSLDGIFRCARHRRARWFAAAFSAAWLTAASPAAAGSGFTELGVPAPVSRARAFYAMNDAEGDRFVLMWLRDVEKNAVLLVDAEDGSSETVELPTRPIDSPYATFLHEERILYAVTGGRFWGFDTRTREWVVDAKVGDREAMVFTRDANGIIYAATYPEGHLMAVDPATGEVTDFGAVNDESWPQYPRELAADKEGWLYVGIGNVASQVAAYHPETGETRALASGEQRQRGRGKAFLAQDGEVYGRLQPSGPWYRFRGGEAIPVEEPGAEPVRFRSGTQEDVFLEFPDGGEVTDFSVADRWFEVADKEGAEPRRVSFDYESAGARIYPLVVGEDGKFYGSTGHPLRFFEYDPVTEGSRSWGFDGSNGHINTLVARGSDVFGAIYVGGILVHYDLTRPIEHTRYGENPRMLAKAGDAVMRPAAIAIHPNGKDIVVTGGGGYGATGGGMMIFDLEAGEKEVLTHEQIVPYHSTKTFVFAPDGNLVGGTSISPGTGGVKKATEAVVYVMDWDSRNVVHQTIPVAGEQAVLDLKTGADGLIYGLTAGGFLFAFDGASREIVSVTDASGYGETTGGQAPRVLHLDENGAMFALFKNAVVAVKAVDTNGEIRHEKVAATPVEITSGGMIVDGLLYFNSRSRLWSFDLAGVRE